MGSKLLHALTLQYEYTGESLMTFATEAEKGNRAREDALADLRSAIIAEAVVNETANPHSPFVDCDPESLLKGVDVQPPPPDDNGEPDAEIAKNITCRCLPHGGCRPDHAGRGGPWCLGRVSDSMAAARNEAGVQRGCARVQSAVPA